MPEPVYSSLFIVATGLSTEATIVVPDGQRFVVKTLTAYTSPGPTDLPRLFFKQIDTDTTLWYAEADFNAAGVPKPTYRSYYGALVFEAGSEFGFQVGGQGVDKWDVFCSGFKFSAG
jgi:hypothetical protein